MTFRYTMAVLIIGATVGCSTSASRITPEYIKSIDRTEAFPVNVASRPLLVGRWLGVTDLLGGVQRIEVGNLRDDGTYEQIVCGKRAGRIVLKETGVGLWGVSGDIFFTIYQGHLRNGSIQPELSNDPNNYDAYRIIKLTSTEFRYSNAVDGHKYRQMKLATTESTPCDET